MMIIITQSLANIVFKIKYFLFFLFFILTNLTLNAQENSSFEFYNQDLKDIVYILSMRSGKSIVCDDTVIGSGNFLYVHQNKGSDFDEIFDAFCKSNKLYVDKQPNLWTVSKIKIEIDDSNKLNINSYDCSIASVFEKISEKTGKSIIYETLPSQRSSFHIQKLSFSDAIKVILQPYSEYTVEETVSGVQIKKQIVSYNEKQRTTETQTCVINYNDGLFDVLISNAQISDVLEKLFFYSNESYSGFIQNTDKVKYLSFSKKDFATSLMLVLEQVNCECVYSEGIWYLFQRNSKSTRDTVTERENKWNVISIINCPAAKIIPLITSKYKTISFVEINSSNIAVYSSEKEFKDIEEYVHNIDSQFQTEVINLKYIKTSDLFNVLPPTVSKEEVIDTGTGNSVFFTGTPEKRELFLKQLKEIDQPKKIVRYDLLILQYDKSSNLSWGASTSIRPTAIGDRTLVFGDLGNLLNINFDLITSFGLTFSEKINAALSNNEASVFADTTLYGLSGEKITFKNTNTFRYKDATIDAETGNHVYNTITREITSGLILEIDGWVSGNDIITMDVKTSVSKQGVDTSNTTGNPPTTTEKNISTKIRARNGEPVVLSGLSQNDLSSAEQGVPGLSQIPAIGGLFKSKTVSKTKTEMTIYLVPHIEENPSEEKNTCWEELLLEYISGEKTLDE